MKLLRTISTSERRDYLDGIATSIVAKLQEAQRADRLYFEHFEATISDRGITVGASLAGEYNSMIFTLPLLIENHPIGRLIERSRFALLGHAKFSEKAVSRAIERVSEADARHAKLQGWPEKAGRAALREREEITQASNSPRTAQPTRKAKSL